MVSRRSFKFNKTHNNLKQRTNKYALKSLRSSKVKKNRKYKRQYYMKGGFKTLKSDIIHCAPNNSEKSVSCFTREGLIKIINSWNKNYPYQKINYTRNCNKTLLWSHIDSKLKKECDNEYCWLKQEFVKPHRSELKQLFRPEMPTTWKKNKNEWLTSVDIEKVMKQYQKKHQDFIFIGPVPIDFDKELDPGMCVVDELCNLKLSKLFKKNIYKLGIIFNLDKHDQSGSHWVAFYGDFYKNKIYYFDSYGYKEPKEVTKLMDRIIQQGKENNRNIEKTINGTRHQYKNSECGVYCLNFIIKLIEGDNFENVANNKTPDDDMEQNRYKLFVKY